MAEQTERSFQKQDNVFVGFRRTLGKKGKKTGATRFFKNVGLGFRTPKEAIEGTYVDKHCPFTGNVSVRGRIIKGVVHSAKMRRTVILRRDYLHYIKKYNRYEKRHRNIPAHLSPCFRVREGDQIVIGQTRPICKTVRFTVLKVESKKSQGVKAFNKF